MLFKNMGDYLSSEIHAWAGQHDWFVSFCSERGVLVLEYLPENGYQQTTRWIEDSEELYAWAGY
jgi:hypothetical protein